MNDDILKLYNALQKDGYNNLGTSDEFGTRLQDENNRRKLYDSLVRDGYNDLGTFEEFSGRLVRPMVDQTQAVRMQPEAQQVPEVPVQKDSVNPVVQQAVPEEDVTLNFDDEPNGLKKDDSIRGFFPALAQGAKNMYYGTVNLLGEAAQSFSGRNVFNPLSWGSRNAQEALDELDRRVAEGLGPNERYADPESVAMRERIMMDPNLSDKEKRRELIKNSVGSAAYEEYAKSVEKQAGGYMKGIERLQHNSDIDKMISTALDRAGGNVDEARRILQEKAEDLSLGDRMMNYASEGLAQAKETKGFGAWLGQQIPMLLPSAAAIGLSAVTKNPKYAEWIGKGSFGLMAASSAGETMNRAREYGATDNEVWSAGLTDAAIMYAAGKIPFNRYTGRLFNTAKSQAAKNLSAALADENSLAAKEAEELFNRASKELGMKFNFRTYLGDIAAHGATMSAMSTMQTMVPMIYEHPEDYPTLTNILESSLAGFRDGVFLGATLGAASQGMQIRNNRARWKNQGGIMFAEMESDGGEPVMVEVVGIDGRAIRRPRDWWNQKTDEFVKVDRQGKAPLAGEGDVEAFDAGEGGTVEVLVDGKLESMSKAEFRKRLRSLGRKTFAQVEEAEVQYQTDNAYEEGYNVHEPSERHDAQNMYEYQRQLLKEKTGLDDVSEENVMFYYENENWTPEQKETVLDYLKAKAARRGMIEGIRDDISRKIIAATTAIDDNTSKTDNMVHPATLKDDRRVYVVDGNIVMLEDGTGVDKSRSMHDLLVRDAETGELFFAPVEDFLSVDDAIDPLQEKQTVAEQLRNGIAQEASDQIDGIVTFNPGDEYILLTDEGHEVPVQVVPNENGVVDNGDGTVNVVLNNAAVDGSPVITPMPKEQIQSLVNAYNLKRLGNYIDHLQEMRDQFGKAVAAPADANAPASIENAPAPAAPAEPTETEQPVIPVDAQGRKQYMQAPTQATYEDIYSDEDFDNDEEAYGFIAGKVKRTSEALKKSQAAVDKIKPENYDSPAEYRAAKNKALEAHKPFQDAYDYWKGVKDLADADIAEAKKRADRAARLEEQALQEPMSLEEVVANGFRGMEHALDKEDFKRETGMSEAELKRFFPFWAKKGQGMSLQGLAEAIAADDQTGLVPRMGDADQADTQAVRDAIVNVFRAAVRPTDIFDYTRKANIARKEQMEKEAANAAERARLEAEKAEPAEEVPAEVAVKEEPAGTEVPETSATPATRIKKGDVIKIRMMYEGEETTAMVTVQGKDAKISGNILVDVGDGITTSVPIRDVIEKVEAPAEPAAPEQTEVTPTQQAIAEAEAQVNTEPTEAQKEAGNYKMGHVTVDGFDISIENPKGSVRRGTSPDGKAWETKMNNTYGYLRRTEGVDGDHIDVFLSDNPEQGNIFVVDQVDPKTGQFDEHKVMYGFNSLEEAKAAYLSNYEEGWKGLGDITEVTRDEFKKWVDSSHRKTKPFAEYKSVKPVEQAPEESSERLPDVQFKKSEAPVPEGTSAMQRNRLFEWGQVAIREAAYNHLLTNNEFGRTWGYDEFAEAYKEQAGDMLYAKDEPFLKQYYDYFKSKLDAAVDAYLETLSKKPYKPAEPAPVEAAPEEPAAVEPAQGTIDFGQPAEEPVAPKTEVKLPATLRGAKEAVDKAIAAPDGKGYKLPEAIYVKNAITEMDVNARELMNAETTKDTRDGIMPYVKNYIDKLADDYAKKLEQYGSPENVVKAVNDNIGALKKKVEDGKVHPEDFEQEAKKAIEPLVMLIRKMRYDKPSTVKGRNYEWEHTDESGFRQDVADLLKGASQDVLERLEIGLGLDLPRTVEGLVRNAREKARSSAEAQQYRQMYFDAHPEMPSSEPKGKFDIWKFIKKDDQRPAMTGIFHDKGYKVASDSHILVAVKDAYPKENEGKIIDKKKNVIDAKYPKWRELLQKGEDSGIDAKHLASFVAGVKELEGKNFKDAKIIVPLGGEMRAFNAEGLENFLRAVQEIGGKITFKPLGSAGKSLMLQAEGKKGYALAMNTMPSNWTSPMFHWYATPAELEQMAKQREQDRTVAEATSLVTGRPVEEIEAEKKPAPKPRTPQEKWDAAEEALAKAVTAEDRSAAMSLRTEALQDKLSTVADEKHPAHVVNYDNVLEQLAKDGLDESVINEVRDGLELDNPNRDTNRAFFIPFDEKGIYIIADEIKSLEDGVSAYVHERQHGITLVDALDEKLAKLPGFDRKAIWNAMKQWKAGRWYESKDDITLADEFLSMAMDLAYKCDTPEVFEQELRKAGIDNEEIITFVKTLDNEQRNSESLSSARQVTLFQDSEQGSGVENGGDTGEVPGGNLGSEGNRPAQGGKASPARRGGGEIKTGPNRQIEDFGEKIAGARKDELRSLSKTLEDATEESFVALPLAKAFKRPNTKKLVENGVITPEDACLVDAVSWLIQGSPKPVKLKDRSWKSKRRDQEIVDWARQQAQRARVVLDYLNADAVGKQAIIDNLANVPNEVKVAADAHRNQILEWNRDRGIQIGELYPLNPIYVAYRVFQSTGYDPDVNGRIKFPIIKCDDLGRSYTVKSGNYGYELAHSVDEALSQATYLVQLQMGVDDIDHPESAFKIRGIRETKVGSGRFIVSYAKKGGRFAIDTKEFDSHDAALAFAKEKYPGQSAEELEKAIYEPQVWAKPTRFRIVAINAATGEEHQLEGEYGSVEEAATAISYNHEDLNSKFNEALQKARESKGDAVNKRDKLYVAWYYENSKGTYGVWAKDKGFWMGAELLKGGFETSREAREYMEAHRAEYEAQLKEMARKRSEFVYFDGDASSRKGKDYRNGKDVGEEEYKVFGFRGVQFGNWANDRDRQAALNNAYDSFMNLAEVLGVSPAALSLNGELGLAFGARGSGSANAHYESNEVVINLTKTRGAGSLAHEWWHALDNYFARRGGIAHGFITASQIPGARPEVQRAFSELSKTIRQSDYGRRSVQKGDYWGSDWEMTARLFAEWVDRKIAEKGESDHFLVRGVDDATAESWKRMGYIFYKARMKERGEVPMPFEEYKKTPDALAGFPYPTTEEIKTTFGPLMEKVFETIEEKTEDGKTVLFSKEAGPLTTYHGTGASFERFDLQFLGSGEGTYVYGPGIYVTDVDGIAKTYADIALGNRLAEVRDGIERLESRLQEIRAGYPAKIEKHEAMAEKFAGTWGGDTHKKFAEYYRQMLETGDYKYDPEAQQIKNAIEYKYGQLNHEGQRHLYTVQIPADNGHNYLPYGDEIPHEDAMRIKAALRARLLSDPNSGYTAKIADILDDELDQAFSYMGGETILGTLDAYLGNDGVGLRSTRFLHDLGFTGIKVPTNFGDPHGDHSANNYVIFDPKDAKIVDHVRYSKLNQWPAEDKEQSRIRFSKVTDQKLLDELEKGETEIGYRNVVMKPDGTLGSPMADKLGKKGQKSVRTTPFAFNEWEQAEENPDMATDDGKINLIKPDGLGSVESVDYNPYIHIRPSKINKQFTQAWKRDNLVFVETLYPASELKGEYHAEKAALSVGRHEWTNGDLILSRWDKPMRIVPWEEVADEWVEEFKDRGVTFDIVPPGLLPVLVERGVEILPPKIAAGAPAREAYIRWRNRGRGVRFSKTNENERIFISNAAEAVNAISMEKATPEQWVKMLEKEGGLKAGEDKWIGLSDWLKSLDRKTLTKQEILDYIRDNEIMIEETHYGSYSKEIEEALQQYQDELDSYKIDLDEDYERADREVAEFYLEMEEKYGENYLYEMTAGEERIERMLLEKREEIADPDNDVNEIAFRQMVDRYGDDFESAFSVDMTGHLIIEQDYNGEMTDQAKYFLGNAGMPGKPINDIRLSYTTDGLENKHEIALTVPTIGSYNESDVVHFGDADNGRAVAWIRFGDARTTVQDEDLVEKTKAARQENAPVFDEISKRHGGKVGAELAAELTQEEKDQLAEASGKVQDAWREEKAARRPDKRVLFIDEIQSKRHQDARDLGYKDVNYSKKMERLNELSRKMYEPNGMPREEYAEYKQLQKEVGRVKAEYDEVAEEMKAKYGNGVMGQAEYWDEVTPEDKERILAVREALHAQERGLRGVEPAPFEKNWHELAFKRMLRYAAEEGYDVVAWTLGEQQAERYDIGKVIDSIDVTPLEKTEFGSNGKGVKVEINYKNNVRPDTPFEFDENGNGTLTDKNLEDYVGKDLAARILSMDRPGTISGDNLRIGAEGMKGFYDDIIPRFANKYGKKWGASTKDILVSLSNGLYLDAHSIEVTPSMKESVMRGQVMFSKEKRETGPFGTILRGYEGKAKEAIQKLMELREGEAIGALSHPEIGAIDLVWGNEGTGHSDGYGLAKLVKYHPEVVDKLQEILNDMHIVSKSENRINLESEKYRAAVRLTWDDQRKTWLLTVFEKKNSALDNTTDTGETSNGSERNDTATPQNTVSESKGSDNSGTSKSSGQKPLFSKLSRDVEDIVNDGKMRVSSENDEARAHLNERMMSIDKNLAKLRMAASAQREYDRETVRSITDLAKRLLDEGALSDPTRQEIEKMLTVTRWATGRKDLDGAVNAIMDLMVGNQLRHAKGVFDGLLKIRGSKVDARGVEVQGKLDAPGQRMMQVFKDAMDMAPEAIEEHIASAETRLDSPDDAVKAAAGDELVGLRMAREYVDDIRASIDEEKGIRNELRQAAEDRRAGRMSLPSYREFVASCDEALRQNRMDRINAYNSLTGRLSGKLYESIARGTAFRDEEKQRIERIHHFANSDLAGQKSDEHGNKNDRLTNNGIFRFLLKPLATFDQMLRHFGSKSVNGEGYLWNHFMRGWVDANDAEFQGMKAATDVLDRKVSDVFGRKMRWSDLYSVERKMPTVSVKFWDGGKMQDHELTQGNLLYIYMVNKMSDGRMKLRRMGIEEEHVNAIKEQMDPRFIELADWLQGEFLVNLRNKYNRVHEKLFGAPMAAIENYFPLKVLANARVREVDMATPDLDGTTPATITGSIIKRRKNALALDVIGTDAFSLVIEHLQQMEHWAAFAPFNQDLNTLLSYKTFRNRVQNMSGIYGAGSIIWENFRKSAEIAAGVYHPSVSRDSIDTAAVNIAKGVTAAKISFRVYTAIKQLLSLPAFISDANVGQLLKSMATPWKSWNWALKDLPGFQKRWLSKQAGDTRLMKTESDWKMWRNDMVKTASRLGMSPNAFVDALTVAVGAKAMYETRMKRYLNDGYTREQAEKRAKQDATILFNETQQSNENAFLSAMQLDRTWASVALTVFRNSSMGYQRQLVDAVRNLGRKLRPDYKDEAVEFMSKQMVRDGVDEQDARDAAERNYRKSTFRDALRVALFGFVVQFAWNLGKYLPYLIAGDDDDEKKKMLKDAALHGLLGGTVEGLSGGSVISEAANLLASGEGLKNYDPSLMPVASDIQRIIKMASYDQVAAANEVVNLLVQAGVGVNPQTLTDIGVAIYDACNGDLETSKEATLLLMRVLQCPQSQVDKVYIDELDLTAEKGLDLSIADFARRYAEYKVRRNATTLGWAYSDEAREKRINTYEKRFTKQAQELIRTRGSDLDRAYYEYVDTEHKEVDATLRDLRSGIRTSAQSGDQMGAMEYAQMLNDFMQTPEFQRYSKAHGNINAIKRLQTALKSADGNSRDAIEDQILQLKKQMVDELKRTDNK